MMKIPFMDLKRQYVNIKKDIDSALQDTIERCAFVAGERVKQFEDNFAQYCGVKNAVGISCGTSALYVALRQLGISEGDIVVTTPFTFIATVEAITMCRATPVFVDIDRDSYTMAIDELRSYIDTQCEWNDSAQVLKDRKRNKQVKGIMPVHLYGQMAAMDEIMEIAAQYRLLVIEDAAQAHGATFKGKRAGTIGHAGCFSFYPSKNLGAYGQGGAIVTSDDALAKKLRMFIDHGQNERYYHKFEGWNFKMDGFQAAVLDVKLAHLDEWNTARRDHAHRYDKQLDGVRRITLPQECPGRMHVYHLYVVHAKERHALQTHLDDAGVGYSTHYPISLHMQDAFRYLGYNKGDFPNAELAAEGVLSLPMFPELTDVEIDRVCDVIKSWN
jgi:dTDP-4-amino-4,6-dideoxygalactose transaminase